MVMWIPTQSPCRVLAYRLPLQVPCRSKIHASVCTYVNAPVYNSEQSGSIPQFVGGRHLAGPRVPELGVGGGYYHAMLTRSRNFGIPVICTGTIKARSRQGFGKTWSLRIRVGTGPGRSPVAGTDTFLWMGKWCRLIDLRGNSATGRYLTVD